MDIDLNTTEIKSSNVDTKTIGELTEQIVITKLMLKGFTVLKPIGDNQRYDIVLDLKGSFYKIQIKTRKITNGKIYCSLKRIITNNHKSERKEYSIDEIDCFIVYCYETDKMYAIPMEENYNPNLILRVDEPFNNQKKNINYAKDYEI